MKIQKLSEEEVAELKEIQTEGNQVQFSLGQVEVAKFNLSKQKDKLISKLDELQKKEITVASKLQEKYGEGNIDLEKGEITITS